MDTGKVKAMGLTMLAKDRILKKDVAEYVLAVNELVEVVDTDARLQRAIENSQKQLEYIFGIIKEFKR